MKFTRTKQLMFTNNKWWVWKTTTSFNIAKMFAKNWYKTVIIDLDPQCNISRLALWESFFENDTLKENDILSVLKWLISWRSDVDDSVVFTELWDNLSILPWNIWLSSFESILSNSFNEAAAGQQRGFFISSAITRFLKRKWLYEEIDLFVIDTNPSLSQLNKSIFLWVNYFVVPMNPDAFNHQGIENIWTFFENEKKNWHMSAKVIWEEKWIPTNEMLHWESIFLWYIINSYNVYSKKPISSQKKWIDILPNQVKNHLSLKQSKNWLVELSWSKPIWEIQDYGQLSTLSQEKSKAIFEITEQEAWTIGTIDNLKKSREEFQVIYEELLDRLTKW